MRSLSGKKASDVRRRLSLVLMLLLFLILGSGVWIAIALAAAVGFGAVLTKVATLAGPGARDIHADCFEFVVLMALPMFI